MKATEQMIDAACQASPTLQREHVVGIVQAALDADTNLSQMEYVDLRQQCSLSAGDRFLQDINGSVVAQEVSNENPWSDDRFK